MLAQPERAFYCTALAVHFLLALRRMPTRFCLAISKAGPYWRGNDMACILIDLENEKGTVLEGISLLNFSKNDEIVVFYSNSVPYITMELHKEFETIKAKKEYIKVETGKTNALDFQLSTYLGFCIQKNPKNNYYIVSKDRDFDCVCRFWQNRSINVKRIDRFCYYKS